MSDHFLDGGLGKRGGVEAESKHILEQKLAGLHAGLNKKMKKGVKDSWAWGHSSEVETCLARARAWIPTLALKKIKQR